MISVHLAEGDCVIDALKCGTANRRGQHCVCGASCGYDTVEAVRKLAPLLRVVHLKDVAASGGEDNILLGQGIAKIPAVMEELHRVSYRGLVAIEYEKEGDVDADIKREVEFARKLA